MIATIIIKDEVNCKITGMGLTARTKCVNAVKYKVPGAFFMGASQLGRWDGTVSFFNIGGSSYVNLLPILIPIIEKEGYEIELDDQRDYSNNISFTPVQEDDYKHCQWDNNDPIQLRDYQVEVINQFLNNTQSIQEVATGAGKTIISAILADKVGGFGRSIIIVPNKSLVTQTEEDYIRIGLDVGVYYGDRKEFGKQHTICTWQSLGIMMKKSKRPDTVITIEEFLEGVVCVMVDEAHMAKAEVLKQLLTGPFAKVPIRWGLTGTIPKDKLDQAGLLVGIGEVINQITAKYLQERGMLSKCHVNVLQLRDYKEYDNYQSELKYLMSDDARQQYIAKLIQEVNKSGNTLILTPRVQAGKELVAKINEIEGREIAVFISGAVKTTKRKEHYDEVAELDDKIIVATYGVAAVGINIPRIFNLVLLEPGKSFIRTIQSIGRGIRKAEDKDFVQIWDITSDCKFAKRHLTVRKKTYKEVQYPFTIEKVDWK